MGYLAEVFMQVVVSLLKLGFLSLVVVLFFSFVLLLLLWNWKRKTIKQVVFSLEWTFSDMQLSVKTTDKKYFFDACSSKLHSNPAFMFFSPFILDSSSDWSQGMYLAQTQGSDTIAEGIDEGETSTDLLPKKIKVK